MRSALKIVAFANGTKFDGIIALLETALHALDEESCREAAGHVDLAINFYISETTKKYSGFPSSTDIIN